MPLIAKLHESKFERKGYNKVTTISPKKHNVKTNYLFSRKLEKA